MADNEGMPGGNGPEGQDDLEGDLFWQEVLNRRDEMPEWALNSLERSIGPRRQTLADQAFQARTAEFRDPSVFMDIQAQLDFMNRFWHRLGFEMPLPSADMQKEMAVSASLQPGKRLIQAILPDDYLTARRRHIVHRASSLPGDDYVTESEVFVTDGYRTNYKALAEAEGSPQAMSGLFYKTGENGLADWQGFKRFMVDNGQAIEDHSGAKWLFGLVDVTGQHNWRPHATRQEMYDLVKPLAVPDLALTWFQLQKINGLSIHHEDGMVVNEAIYDTDDGGEPTALQAIVRLHWSCPQKYYLLVAGRSDSSGLSLYQVLDVVPAVRSNDLQPES